MTEIQQIYIDRIICMSRYYFWSRAESQDLVHWTGACSISWISGLPGEDAGSVFVTYVNRFERDGLCIDVEVVRLKCTPTMATCTNPLEADRSENFQSQFLDLSYSHHLC